MMANKHLQKGDLVLITGGTGWVGSHIVDNALKYGLKVRLAIRNEEKARSLIEALKARYGSQAHIETAIVKDFNSENAYDEAVKGVHGVIHAASVLSFSSNWDDVIPPTLNGYSALLTAAHAQGSAIKRFVLTSSSVALGASDFDPAKYESHLDRDSWNDRALEEARHEPNMMNIYAASKVLSERLAWDFVKTHKPAFILNTVNPFFCTGGKIPGTNYSSTGQMLRNVVFEADQTTTQLPSAYLVDVDDVGLLHILAAVREDVASERIIACSEAFTWDDFVQIAQKYRPEKVNAAPKRPVPQERIKTVVDNKRTEEILQAHGGLRRMESSVRLNLQD